MYNEMDGNFDDVAINTYKSSFPAEHGLRKSLTGKPATNVRQLMDRIDKYKLVEEDQMQGRGKENGYPSREKGFQVEPIHKQSFEERLRRATRDNQRTECRGCIPRTSTPGAREN